MGFSREQFLAVEEKYGLNELRCGGFPFWALLRTEVYRKLKRHAGGAGGKTAEKAASSPIRGRLEAIRGMLRVIRSGYFHPQRLKRHVDILFRVHPRRVLEDGYYRSIYTDGLLKHYPNSMCIENHYITPGFHHKPVEEEVYYLDRLGFAAGWWARLQIKLRTKRFREVYAGIGGLKEPLGTLYEMVGLPFRFEKERAWMTRFTLECIKLEALYMRLLAKIDPKVIVEVISYSKETAILNLCAKKLGIPTVEVQHGQINIDHMAYQYPPEASAEKLPDHFLSFGDYWNELIHFPRDSVRVISAGFPYFEKERMKYIGASSRGDGKKEVLFLPNLIDFQLAEVAARLADILDESEYRIVYKLHPSEAKTWRTLYPQLDRPGIRMIDTTDIPLYQLLSEADVQVGTKSTAIFEGFGFGLRTYILKCGDNSSMQELGARGIVQLFSDAEELKALLLAPGDGAAAVDTQYFWKEDALNNMREQIDRLLAERSGR